MKSIALYLNFKFKLIQAQINNFIKMYYFSFI